MGTSLHNDAAATNKIIKSKLIAIYNYNDGIQHKKITTNEYMAKLKHRQQHNK